MTWSPQWICSLRHAIHLLARATQVRMQRDFGVMRYSGSMKFRVTREREWQRVAGGHKGRLTWMWEDTTKAVAHMQASLSNKKQDTPVRLRLTQMHAHQRSTLRGISCQSWCGGQDEDSLPDSQEARTKGQTQRMSVSLG